ncbi:MAG TPA: flagellar hook-length control protein FliK, partial [Chloroflexota bacterium]|nr:flagellar hook-length control protein FliK [Chloroflexota bacterium]
PSPTQGDPNQSVSTAGAVPVVEQSGNSADSTIATVAESTLGQSPDAVASSAQAALALSDQDVAHASTGTVAGPAVAVPEPGMPALDGTTVRGRPFTQAEMQNASAIQGNDAAATVSELAVLDAEPQSTEGVGRAAGTPQLDGQSVGQAETLRTARGGGGGGAQSDGAGRQSQDDRGGAGSSVASPQTPQFPGVTAGDGSSVDRLAAQPVTRNSDAATTTVAGIHAVEVTARREVAGAAASAAAADPQSADSVFNQLLEQASKLSVPRNTRMRVHLTPPSLGELDLKLDLKDGVLSLGITAELGKTRELIQAALPELRQALQQKGLDVGQFSLSTGSGEGAFGGLLGNSAGSFGAGNQWAGGGRQSTSVAQNRSSAQAEVPGPDGQRAVDSNGSSQHLVDYRI